MNSSKYVVLAMAQLRIQVNTYKPAQSRLVFNCFNVKLFSKPR